MKLHRDLKITQKTAWLLSQKIRQGWLDGNDKLHGSVEVDETYIGGKEANKHRHKKNKEGRGSVAKQAVIGIKSRETNCLKAQVIAPVSASTLLQRFVDRTAEKGATVYSDQNPGYIGLKRQGYTHESVNHSTKEFVSRQVHTNGY